MYERTFVIGLDVGYDVGVETIDSQLTTREDHDNDELHNALIDELVNAFIDRRAS